MRDLLSVLALLFVAGLFATVAESIRHRNVPALVNGVGAILLTLVPVTLLVSANAPPEWQSAVTPLLTLWLASAGFLHLLGMLGLYDALWWWDHLTHTFSGALVAALVYAAMVVSGVQFGLPIGPAAVLVTFTVGIVWELIELVARELGEHLDIQPVLVHYGWRDTGFDLLFDFVGALLIVVTDSRFFVPLAERFPQMARTLLVDGTTLAVISCLLMTGVVVGGRRVATANN